MASLGRSANVSKMQAKRAASRLSGKTVPAATRAAHRVCVCIEPPPSVSKLVASYSFLIIHYRPFGPLPQLTEVVGNGQQSAEGRHGGRRSGLQPLHAQKAGQQKAPQQCGGPLRRPCIM